MKNERNLLVWGSVAALITIAALAAPARADESTPTTPTRATVVHVPHSTAVQGQQLRLIAVIDDAWTEGHILVRYRRLGSPGQFRAVAFERSSAGGYFATIPAETVSRPGLEYYIAGTTARDGAEINHFASASQPQLVRVRASEHHRWKQRERERLRGYMSTMTLDMWGQNFGTRHKGHQDYYTRGEVDWTHRLLGKQLYSISLGFGFVEGRTPDGRATQADALDQGGRYGYGGVRLRVHESASVAGRAILGVSHDGFVVGGRAVLTLGKHWRSSVDLGAEYIGDLGPSLWVRLQWDTVYPFIMGASIVKTDLPGAELDNGAYIQWDVTYPVADRFSVRGNLSFGSRDGPGNFGGGLGGAFAF